MLETPENPTVLVRVTPGWLGNDMSSDNPIGADNQQERLDDYFVLHMNGGGKYRKLDWSSRILRGHMPNTN